MKNTKKKESKWPKLPKAFKNKWLKALRGGDYKKGIGTLEQTDDKGQLQYCCLGVACRMQHPNMKIKGTFISSVYFKRLRDINVPDCLKSNNEDNELPSRLAQMNDSRKSFKVIANWIEKNL